MPPEDPSQPAPATPPAPSGASSSAAEQTVLMNSGAALQVVGDFEIIGKLGQGGMGTVYRARQRSLDRQVALKILPATLEADAEFVSRFQREARVAAGLSHGNLVKVYAAGEADGCHFIAMELVEGETLSDLLKRGPLSPAEALRILGAAARALDYGWQRAQLIHRDIKPGNIFLSAQGAVKVGDLGLAKSMEGDATSLTQTGTAMGTPHYISPEQARGESDLDFRADIYSLGCTLFQMLTGRTPYGGTDAMAVMSMHRDAPPPAILKVLPSCPLPLARLVSKMLKKAKRERPASYPELIAEIERTEALFAPAAPTLSATFPPDPDSTHLATPSPTPRSATPITQPLAPSSAKSKAPLYGGLVVGAVVLGIVAFLAWPKPSKLTKAELLAQQRAPSTPVPVASAAPAASGESSPATATKDAPFVNGLGMKFVPVPILGGPTGGKRVLFSVWETRVQDYEVFIQSGWTKRESQKPGFEQGPTHPVVMVNWDDATAFSTWLTERERKAGRLGANEVYRLPTDHEWSCAVGLGTREVATKLPDEKDGVLTDALPWGQLWPPPPGVANLAGEELQPALAAGKHGNIKRLIAGYRDDVVETAPVGQFPANPLGLYDLAGNAREWCEDWLDAAHQYRVLRGGSWNSGNQEQLLSSNRSRGLAGARNDDLGFRVVLAPAP